MWFGRRRQTASCMCFVLLRPVCAPAVLGWALCAPRPRDGWTWRCALFDIVIILISARARGAWRGDGADARPSRLRSAPARPGVASRCASRLELVAAVRRRLQLYMQHKHIQVANHMACGIHHLCLHTCAPSSARVHTTAELRKIPLGVPHSACGLPLASAGRSSDARPPQTPPASVLGRSKMGCVDQCFLTVLSSVPRGVIARSTRTQ